MSAAGIFASSLVSDATSLFAPKSPSTANKSNSASQSAFSAIQEKLSALDSGSNSGASPLTTQLSQLGKDLASGNLSASQADFTALRTSLGIGTSPRSGHPSGIPIQTGPNGTPAGSVPGSASASAPNPWLSAMQAYSSLQQNPINGGQSASLLLPGNTFSTSA